MRYAKAIARGLLEHAEPPALCTSRRASATPTHEKKRQANQGSIGGHEEEKAEEDPDAEQRPP
jgi:hypothetical protein